MHLAAIIVEIISIIFLIFTFFIGIVHRDKTFLYPIQLYILTVTILDFIDLAFWVFGEQGYHPVLSAFQNIQIVLEIVLILYFFYMGLKRKGFRNTLIIFVLIFFTTCYILWTTDKDALFGFYPDLIGIESLFITTAGLLYLYELLSSDFLEDLISNPNFLVTCGVLFCFGISAPISFCWQTLYDLSPSSGFALSIVSQTCTFVLVVSIMKAYLCPLPKNQQ